MDLLVFKKNIFSQNGEDGIISEIFNQIGIKYHRCCEFGAWDGIHLSNTRNLLLNGWSGVLIEGDPGKCVQLNSNYAGRDDVSCIEAFVDTGENTLATIFERNGIKPDLDFLSIDVDGLDYEIFESMRMRPRVVCIEVNAGHSPYTEEKIEREIARDNIGQPLKYLSRIAAGMGYILVCFSGNAFFILESELAGTKIKKIDEEEIYRNFLQALTKEEREWLYFVNRGLVHPFHQFHNPFLEDIPVPLGKKMSFMVRYLTHRLAHGKP